MKDNQYAVVMGVDLGTMAQSGEMGDNPGYEQFRGSTPAGNRVTFVYKGPISTQGDDLQLVAVESKPFGEHSWRATSELTSAPSPQVV